MESFTPYLLTAETIDRDPLLTLESSDQLLIFGTIAPIDTVLGQVRLALADAPPAPNELLWERLEPVLVVLPRPLPVLEVSAVGTIGAVLDRKSTRLNSSHVSISYAVFCLKNKK